VPEQRVYVEPPATDEVGMGEADIPWEPPFHGLTKVEDCRLALREMLNRTDLNEETAKTSAWLGYRIS